MAAHQSWITSDKMYFETSNMQLSFLFINTMKSKGHLLGVVFLKSWAAP